MKRRTFYLPIVLFLAFALNLHAAGDRYIGEHVPTGLTNVDAADVTFTPGNGDWVSSPTTAAEGLDQLATALADNNASLALQTSTLSAHTADTTSYPHDTKATYDFSSSSGWTTTNGSGTASITSGKARLVIPLNTVATYDGSNGYNGPVIFRSHGANKLDFVVYARLSAFTNADSLSNTGIEIRNTDASQKYALLVISDGTVYTVNLTSNTNISNTAASALPLNGTGWMMIRVTPGAICFWYGTGTSSTPPTTWTLAYLLPQVALTKPFDRVGPFLRQVISGNPAQLTADWDDLRTIDFGGLWSY
jgi:hypothetical protein